MDTISTSILAINGGSSSIRFAVYKLEKTLTLVFSGIMEKIGKGNTKLTYTNIVGDKNELHCPEVSDFASAAKVIADLLEKEKSLVSLMAIGHRIVHGMKHTAPEVITPELLAGLNAISAYDPEHLPAELAVIEVFKMQYPSLLHIACFDTAFHTDMPTVAKWIPIPRRFYEEGIQRYGFHGLSYAYLMEELGRIAGSDAANGKVILVHLGNGASIAAVKDGKSIDTSMGFTPTAGLLMGTRSGDLDPGVVSYLLQSKKLDAEQFNHLVNHESGMLGISEVSSDMRELLKLASTDHRAAEAIELFCYQVKKWIGAYAAVLGGVDTVVFSGGIGEHAPEIRERICHGLQFLGITLEPIRNIINEEIVSSDGSNVRVRVMKTNEELMIARLVQRVLTASLRSV